jgi:hypothetical protein
MDLTHAQIEAVRKAIPEEWDGCLEDDRVDHALDLLSAAPEVDVVYAWGPGEPYAVSVCGVPGAYVVKACEFDDVGAFSTLKEAREAREDAWAGVDLFDAEEDVWSYAREQGFL